MARKALAAPAAERFEQSLLVTKLLMKLPAPGRHGGRRAWGIHSLAPQPVGQLLESRRFLQSLSWIIDLFSASKRPASFFSRFRIAASTYAERSPSGSFSRKRGCSQAYRVSGKPRT